MDGIEKIAQRILEDAQAEVAQRGADAQKQADEILAQGKAQAETLYRQQAEKGKKQAEELYERLVSAVEMEKRQLSLAAKQELLQQVFSLALEKLVSLPEQDYIQTLKNLILAASVTGKEQVVFSPADRARIGKHVVVAANEAMTKGYTPELPSALQDSRVGSLIEKMVSSSAAMITGTGLLTLSEQTRPIKGGFILIDGDVETNCSFDTLLRLKRKELEKEMISYLLAPEEA